MKYAKPRPTAPAVAREEAGGGEAHGDGDQREQDAPPRLVEHQLPHVGRDRRGVGIGRRPLEGAAQRPEQPAGGEGDRLHEHGDQPGREQHRRELGQQHPGTPGLPGEQRGQGARGPVGAQGAGAHEEGDHRPGHRRGEDQLGQLRDDAEAGVEIHLVGRRDLLRARRLLEALGRAFRRARALLLVALAVGEDLLVPGLRLGACPGVVAGVLGEDEGQAGEQQAEVAHDEEDEQPAQPQPAQLGAEQPAQSRRGGRRLRVGGRRCRGDDGAYRADLSVCCGTVGRPPDWASGGASLVRLRKTDSRSTAVGVSSER